VEDDEVHAGEGIGEPALPRVTSFGLEPVDEINHVVEPAAAASSNATSGDGDRQVGFAGAGSTDQHGIALLGEESAAGEVAYRRLIDRRAVELEVVEVLGERQLGDGELVLDRTCLLLVDLGGEQIADNALGFLLALDRGGHDLLESGRPAVEMELAHEVEQFGSFHQMVLLRLS